MRKHVLHFLAAVIAIGGAGCMSADLSATGYDKTASMTSTEGKFTIVKHFTREIHCWYTLLNLIPLTQPNVAEVLNEETVSSHGDAIINMTIRGETKLLDAGITAATAVLGSVVSHRNGVLMGLLIGARTYTIEGDVIQYLDR